MAYVAGAFAGFYWPHGTSAYITGSPIQTDTHYIGHTKDGFHIREDRKEQVITADDGGETPMDHIHQGIQVEVQVNYLEYDKLLNALYAQAPIGNPMANVGLNLGQLAGTLWLCQIGGTPPATNFETYTFTGAIVLSDIETLMSSKLREGPVTFRALDQGDGTAYGGSFT